MEHARHKIDTNTKAAYVEELPFNGYRNIYYAMCVKNDFTYGDSATLYTPEDLTVEGV